MLLEFDPLAGPLVFPDPSIFLIMCFCVVGCKLVGPRAPCVGKAACLKLVCCTFTNSSLRNVCKT